LTGGTAKTLKEEGIKVTPIEKVTQNSEAFDGRMKTISFQIGSAILYDRKNKKHLIDQKDYKRIIKILKTERKIPEKIRFQLAHKAFKRTAEYDKKIAKFFKNVLQKST